MWRGETFDEERFDFRRDGVLEAFGFRVRFGPRNADDFGEKHFRELMAEHEVLGDFAALGGEQDLAIALNLDVAVARHAFYGGGNGGGSDVEFFGQAGADGELVFLAHLPDGLEVIFLRNAGFIATQRNSIRYG